MIEDHSHCPYGCEHPQPFVDLDGDEVCGKCWYDSGDLTVMVPCTPEICGSRDQLTSEAIMIETVFTLPFPKIGKGFETYTLKNDLYIEEWVVPAGTEVILNQTRDFRWIHLPKGCRDTRGFTIPRRVFRI